MQLPGKILDGGNDARGRTIDGIADYSESAIVHSIEERPTRLCRKSIKIVSACIGVGRGKDEEVWLQGEQLLPGSSAANRDRSQR